MSENRNPVSDLPLSEVLRDDIVLVLGAPWVGIFTLGDLLRAWDDRRKRSFLEWDVFDSPADARECLSLCYIWTHSESQYKVKAVLPSGYHGHSWRKKGEGIVVH